VKFVNLHPMKIDVIKFDGMNNFGMWMYEVMDALTVSNLEDTLYLEEKSEESSEKDWDKMNRTMCRLVRSCLTQNIKYHMLYETSARKMWDILEKKYLIKRIESRLHLKRRLYCFQLNREFSIDEHMNNNTKLLTDLVSVDVSIEEEDKALILLNSLSDKEYETFILTLINGKQILNYSDMSAALINSEVKRKDKQLSSNDKTAEAMTARGVDQIIRRAKESLKSPKLVVIKS